MPDETSYIWMGVLLRVSGESFSFIPHRRIIFMDGFFFEASFGRQELCRAADVSIVLQDTVCRPKGNPQKSLASLGTKCLEATRRTLSEVPAKLFQQWRSEQRKMDILVATHTRAQKVRFAFPGDFTKLCAELQLPIEVYMDHDIPTDRPQKAKPKAPK